MPSTQDWNYKSVSQKFSENGCSIAGCPFSHPQGCATDNVLCCSLNLSNAIIQSGYSLLTASNVNYCSHTDNAPKRVRNADGMARICKAQNSGRIDRSKWANRPDWKGIVYFEGGLSLSNIYDDLGRRALTGNDDVPEDFAKVFLATGHVDLWNGTKGVHAQYPDATTIWFWKMS